MGQKRHRAYKVIAWLEKAWLIIFGFLLFGYVRAEQLKLFLSPSWTWLIITAGALSVLMGTCLLLFGREQEDALIVNYLDVTGKWDPLWRSFTILLLVGIIVVGFLVPGRTLTVKLQEFKDVGSGAFLDTGEKSYRKALGVPEKERTIKDWVLLMRYEEDPRAFVGQKVQLTGRVLLEENMPPEQFIVVRYLLTHCISCASPLFLPARVAGDERVPEEGSWITLEGRFGTTARDGEEVPIIDVQRYRVIDTPSDPYLYP